MSLGNLGSPGGLEALGFLRVSEATYISLGFGTFFLMKSKRIRTIKELTVTGKQGMGHKVL